MSADLTGGPAVGVGVDDVVDPTVGVQGGGTPGKERHSLTLDQRRALRRWANSQSTRPSHKACIEWFELQYHQTISQSTVSHSLSPKYARLDGDPQLSGSRLRFGNWPDVEKVVLSWYQSSVAVGRPPTNEELAEKAKSIFHAIPRYKDEQAPEFSPGWIHRFKKRYGLLIRRQRRHGSTPGDMADNMPYLVDAVPRFMNVSAETSPAAIRDTVQRVIGIEANLAICARVRDEIVHRLENPQGGAVAPPLQPPNGHGADAPMYEEDPEVVLQNALRAMQQEEADAEAEAAVAREERDRTNTAANSMANIAPSLGGTPVHQQTTAQAYAQQAAAGALANTSTPMRGGAGGPNGSAGRFAATPGPPPGSAGGGPATQAGEDLMLTPIPSGAPISMTEKPMRCPYCVNQRMLRTIKEAVEHMSTHVVI